MARTIGIDFGTTNSAAAYIENGKPKIIPNHRNERLTPSVVAFFSSGESIVGTAAKNQSITNPQNTVAAVKRKIGSGEKINMEASKPLSAEEVAAKIIRRIKEDAEDYIGEPVNEAIITVPAYFPDSKRQATKDAGKIAGLKILRIINEPTAAALSYGANSDKEERLLVYDLGGGTFDVSVLDIADGVFEVLATAGDNYLGGDDFDKLIIDKLLSEFYQETSIDLRNDPMAMQKLKNESEKAKMNLSKEKETSIEIPFISADQNGPKHIKRTLSRAEFEDLIQPLAQKTIELTAKAIEDAGLEIENVDRVLMVGGSTRIPMIRSALEEFTGKKAIEMKIDPEESVAIGAAIQCGIMKGDVKGTVLVDVTPLTLGIEIDGGLFVPLILRNSPIPCSAQKGFTTISDMQTVVEIHVLQGERKVAKENISLGKFQLNDIRPAKKGEPRIEVTFSIDVDGIVNVSATDSETQRKEEVSISDSLGLDEMEVKRMLRQAEINKEEDRKFQHEVEVKYDAALLLRKIEYIMKETIDDDEQDELENYYNELDNALENKTMLEEVYNRTRAAVNDKYGRSEA